VKDVFAPCSLGALTVRNRIIRSATHEGMARADGGPTDDLLRIYRRLAVGGAGAIITGYVGVLQGGKTFANMRMFDSDALVSDYQSLNDALKPHGAPVILQLAHGGSHCSAKVTGRDVIGPSRRRRNEYGDVCRAASEAEIEEIIEAFVRAVVRARAAGFDGVQIHAAHGYLLSEFISPVLNKRTDHWGGPLENRMRIVTEILVRARAEVGSFPILVKISGADEFRHGLTGDDAVAIARLLRQSSCDAIEVSCGYGKFFFTVRVPAAPVDAILGLVPGYRELSPFRKRLVRLVLPFMGAVCPPLLNYNVERAALIRRHVDIPVIVVGGIRTLEDIREIVEGRGIDCVSLSRPFIIEPDIVARFQKGQPASRCINCGYCLMGVTSGALRCYYGRLPRGVTSPAAGSTSPPRSPQAGTETPG
jgi:2,4-dienoyl-CoA reductase-like NADH-dependent reductase (Old Yellow Enzyme family)